MSGTPRERLERLRVIGDAVNVDDIEMEELPDDVRNMIPDLAWALSVCEAAVDLYEQWIEHKGERGGEYLVLSSLLAAIEDTEEDG